VIDILDKVGRQPQGWLIAEGLGLMALVGAVDIATTWRFTMFGFYGAIVFFISCHLRWRSAVLFVFAAVGLMMIGELDSIPVRGLDGYLWSTLNRICGTLFAAGCGIALRRLRGEMLRRVEALEHAQELERDLVRAGEQEQMRLGQDLHDGLCQTLAALHYAAEFLRSDLEVDKSSRIKTAIAIQNGLSEATQEARNLARGIYPSWNEGETLVTALETVVRRLNTLWRGQITFESSGDVLPRNLEAAMHLYRVTQEALQNALRHANATKILVDLQVRDQLVNLSVCDNGCGSGTQFRGDGIGSRTMRYRAKLINADLSISSPAEGGTIVRCSVPARSLDGEITISSQEAELLPATVR
jgi:signal transduction histidine kinase